jgi:hypothetical protein
MTGRRFQDIWKEQCEAARGVREQHGVVSALDYLIGEKLMTYAETAVRRPEFARELPRFVAEIRSIFSVEEIRRGDTVLTSYRRRFMGKECQERSAHPRGCTRVAALFHVRFAS